MCACITLEAMGKGDNNSPRVTRELDPARLAALSKQPLPEGVEVTEDDDSMIVLGRVNTLNDPMTTSLLAEVARRNQTQDFDDERIEKMLDDVDDTAPAHPHTTKRAK
jgi:hypothetical protein